MWKIAALLFCLITSAAGAQNLGTATGKGSQSVPANFFGIHINTLVDNSPNNTPWPTDFSVPIISSHNTGTFWANINTSNGVYDWSLFDTYITETQANGALVLYSFFQTPAWASSNSGGTCSGLPNGSCYPPTSNTSVSTFITALIAEWTRVAPTMPKAIECWNEPDTSSEWAGTQAQLVSVCQTVYNTAKAIDSTIQIGLPPVTLSDTTSPTWMATYLAAGGMQYADFIGVHLYPTTESNPPPETVVYSASALNFFNAILGPYNTSPAKPIWDTESGWGPNTQLAATADQIAFLARHHLLIWSLGVSRLYWYSYDDPNWGTLWSLGGGLNTVGTAYQQIKKWMIGALMTQPCLVTSGSVIYTCNFSRPGYQAQAVWTSDSSTPSYTVPSFATQYHDLAGTVTTGIGATVTIGPKPILLENKSVF